MHSGICEIVLLMGNGLALRAKSWPQPIETQCAGAYMGQQASMSYCNKHWEDHENTFALNTHTHTHTFTECEHSVYSHIAYHGHLHSITHMSLLLDAGINIKSVFPRYGIPMLKIRRSWDRLIFNMEIPILVRRHLDIETVHRILLDTETKMSFWPNVHHRLHWTFIILTTFSAASDDYFIKMKTFPFQCIYVLLVHK